MKSKQAVINDLEITSYSTQLQYLCSQHLCSLIKNKHTDTENNLSMSQVGASESIWTNMTTRHITFPEEMSDTSLYICTDLPSISAKKPSNIDQYIIQALKKYRHEYNLANLIKD